jgi:uncharacterized membrane protein YkvA (DUF1232 family)
MLTRIIGKELLIKQNVEFYGSLYDDSRVPRMAKWLLWSAIGYTFLPFDLIPDFVPVIGQLDDIVIVPILVWLAIRMIPKDLYEGHLKADIWRHSRR